MKNMIAKLASAITRMMKPIDRMYAEYERAINEFKGTPVYFPLYECYEMM